jgi:hypothetical protein
MAYKKRSLSLKEYLTDEFNVINWREIEQNNHWKGIFKQKAFFDLLYKEFDFFAEYSHSYYDITKHFEKLKLQGLKRHCILYYLIQVIDKYYYSIDLNEGVLSESHKFIFDLFVETDKEIFPAEKKNQLLNFDEISPNDNIPEKEQQQNSIEVTNEKIPFIGNLLYNLNLSEIVLDYYYRLVQQPYSQEQVSKHYAGDINRYNDPYHLSIYGAYVNMKDWDWLKMKIDNKYPPFDKVSDNELEDAKKQYAIGFKYGYFNFEKDKLDQSIFQDSANKAQIIFDFAKGRMFPSSGFSESSGKGVHVLSGWKDDGIEGGYIYRAWYLMLENHFTFAPLFETWKGLTQPDLNNEVDKTNFREDILKYLENDLKDRCKDYLQKVNNPLATDLHFLNIEIECCNKAIEQLTEDNNKHHHGQASPLEYIKINWLNKLEIAKKWKLEIINSNTGENHTELKQLKEINKNIPITGTYDSLITKTDYLKAKFKEYGFYTLEKVSVLSEQNADLLLKKLIDNRLPYIVAMIDYLGFIKHLSKEYFPTSKNLDKKISEWFKSDKDGRTVRGNRNSLLKPDKRYTANQHKENVQKDYQSLK